VTKLEEIELPKPAVKLAPKKSAEQPKLAAKGVKPSEKPTPVVVAKKVETPKPVEAPKPVAVAKPAAPAPVVSKPTVVAQAAPKKVEQVAPKKVEEAKKVIEQVKPVEVL
jgi:hypothetical protein